MNIHAEKSKGVFITKLVIHDKRFTIKDRFVMSVLLYLQDKGFKDYIFPTNEFLSDVTALKMVDIEDSLRSFVNLGLIELDIDRKYNNRIIYVNYGV